MFLTYFESHTEQRMCSPFGIRDFPILNSVAVTPSLNASIYEELPLDIQWGPKATEPTFIQSGQYANLGFIEYLTDFTLTTTLRLNGNSFTLISVQLCEPQHKSLLVQAKQSNCAGEIVMVFKTKAALTEAYVILSVPIVTQATSKLSSYLEALRTGQLTGKPTSLETLLPEDKHFISYSTCLERIESAGSSTKQARVFVFTEGLSYPAQNFQEIVNKIVNPPPEQKVLPAIQLPDNLRDKTQALLFSITTETDYKSLLRYNQYYSKGQPDSSQYRTDRLESYKCVPLEPSQNVKDGKIIVDTESGELLSQVLEDPQEGQGVKPRPRITPAMVEKVIAICVALVLIAFVFLILAYVVTNMTTPNADSFFGIVVQQRSTIAPILFFSILSGIIFFVLGIFLHTML